jgi:hypothetical protein
MAVAHITWSSPSTIAGDTDVSTNGPHFSSRRTLEPFFMHDERFAGGIPILNGLQLRAVADPASIGLVAWAAILLLGSRAKRRN